MNTLLIASACAAAVLCFATASPAQTTRNRTERVTVNGCFIRGSEYAAAPHTAAYVLRDAQTVEPKTTASISSPSSRTAASYGTETTGRATVSDSVSGQDTAGVEGAKGVVAASASNKGSEVDRTVPADHTPTGTTGTTGVVSPSLTAYTLEGVTQPAAYIGKRVEITGMLMAAPSTPRATASPMSRLSVSSMRVVDGSCR